MKNKRNDSRPKRFLQPPEYPGGAKELNNFIKKNIRIPEEAIRNQIKGVVRLQIEIDYRGIVFRVDILQSLGYGCDEEAERLAKLLQFLPSHNRKVRVGRKMKLNIPFDSQASSFQITYELSTDTSDSEGTDKEPENKPKSDNGNGYGYTITIG